MTIENMWIAPSTASDGSTLWFVFAAGHSNFRCIDIASTEEEARDMMRNIEAGASATNPYYDNEGEQEEFSDFIRDKCIQGSRKI
jgi:hypothetical protein